MEWMTTAFAAVATADTCEAVTLHGQPEGLCSRQDFSQHVMAIASLSRCGKTQSVLASQSSLLSDLCKQHMYLFPFVCC
jgi:hypothetical protein